MVIVRTVYTAAAITGAVVVGTTSVATTAMITSANAMLNGDYFVLDNVAETLLSEDNLKQTAIAMGIGDIGGMARVRSASEFHDVLVDIMHITDTPLNQLIIPPAFAVNYCAASPQFCAVVLHNDYYKENFYK